MMRSESTLCSCVYTHTHTHTHFVSTLDPSTPVLPAVHLSSQTSLSDDSPRSVPPLLSLRNVIFHFCWVYMVLWALSSPSFFFLVSPPLLTPSLFFHLLLFIFSHSSPLSLQTKPPEVADVQRKGKQNGQSVNSWHLGLALSARTKWTAVSLVWSVLFMPFKVTTSTRPLWSKEYTNTGWHRAEPHYYIWVISSLQILLV